MAMRMVVFMWAHYRTFPFLMPAILYFANRLPFPVDDGWKSRTYHVLRAAAETGPTALVTLGGHSAEAEQQLRAALGKNLSVHVAEPMRFRAPRALVRGLLTSEPYQAASQRSAAFRRIVRELAVTQPRVVLASTFFVAPYHDLVPGSKLVVDTHNVDSANLARYVPQLPTLRRLYATLTVPKMQRSERYWSERASELWACSAEDARMLGSTPALEAKVTVISNGVDADAFAYRAAPRLPHTFVFFGRLDYFPNLDAIEYLVREIMPLVPADVPMRIRIVGAGDATPIKRLIANDQRFEYVGRVDDVRDEVGSAVASLVPLRAGGGTRLKLLESLALGTPAITTSVGAEGLLPDIAAGVWLADTPQLFAERLAALARDPLPAQELGLAGRRAVESRYHWGALVAQMRGRLERLIDA